MNAREVIFSFVFREVCELINASLGLPKERWIDPTAVRLGLHREDNPPPEEAGRARTCTNCWSLQVKPLDAGREQCQMCGHVQDEPVRYRAQA